MLIPAIETPGAKVNPFIGTEATTLPPPEGFARRWKWIKAEVGNTHPGACYPFGMVSACAYSGAYSSGYGLYQPSSSGQPKRAFDGYAATGFTHFQHTGAGALGYYYNYLKVIPAVGELDQIGTRWKLENETARPGYYSATLGGSGIKAELTVGGKCAVHRYTYPASDRSRIVVDLSAGGLGIWERDERPTQAELQILSNTEACGHIVCAGLPIFFHLQTDVPAWKAEAFSGSAVNTERSLSIAGGPGPYGIVFTGKTRAGQAATIRIGFSLRSVEQAEANLLETGRGTFDDVATAAGSQWEQYLSRIEVTGGTREDRTLFYTSLYHSLLKPADFTGENPRSKSDGPFFLDVGTMWDMYKTVIPLMNAVYPERAQGLMNSLLWFAEYYGEFPNSVLMNGDFFDRPHSHQASGLALIAITDAHTKGVKGVDWKRAEKLMLGAYEAGVGKQFAETGMTERLTHVQDLSYAAYCASEVAKAVGDPQAAQRMLKLAANWRNICDPATGLLVKGQYYEGDLWNYSFRLLHDMSGRISLLGGDEKFCETLDHFFGITEPPADPTFTSWEALNNEPDMETPYAYIYAGRQDRTAEVARATLKYRFAATRGGLPGNDDSGGTSAWYVWSAMGLFPVVGQDVFLIGSPIFRQTKIRLGDKSFVIEAKNTSDANIYVQRAQLDGKDLDRAYLRFAEMKAGGRLVLEMGPSPSKWGAADRPPSHR